MYVYDKHLSSGPWECKENIDNLKNWLVYHNSQKLKSKRHDALMFNILNELFFACLDFFITAVNALCILIQNE